MTYLGGIEFRKIIHVESKYHYWNTQKVFSKYTIQNLYSREDLFEELNKSNQNFNTLVLNVSYLLFLKRYFPKITPTVKSITQAESLIYCRLRDYDFICNRDENLLRNFFKDKVKSILEEDFTYRTLILWKVLFYQFLYLDLTKTYGKNYERCNNFISQMYQLDFSNECFELPEYDILSSQMLLYVLEKTTDATLKSCIKEYLESK